MAAVLPAKQQRPAAAAPLLLKVCASRTFNVLPICENIYDLGNLAAVCRSADGERRTEGGSTALHAASR